MVSFDDLKGSTKSGQTGSNINCTGEGKVCFDVFMQGKARYILCKTNANRSFCCVKPMQIVHSGQHCTRFCTEYPLPGIKKALCKTYRS